MKKLGIAVSIAAAFGAVVSFFMRKKPAATGGVPAGAGSDVSNVADTPKDPAVNDVAKT